MWQYDHNAGIHLLLLFFLSNIKFKKVYTRFQFCYFAYLQAEVFYLRDKVCCIDMYIPQTFDIFNKKEARKQCDSIY